MFQDLQHGHRPLAQAGYIGSFYLYERSGLMGKRKITWRLGELDHKSAHWPWEVTFDGRPVSY